MSPPVRRCPLHGAGLSNMAFFGCGCRYFPPAPPVSRAALIAAYDDGEPREVWASSAPLPSLDLAALGQLATEVERRARAADAAERLRASWSAVADEVVQILKAAGAGPGLDVDLTYSHITLRRGDEALLVIVRRLFGDRLANTEGKHGRLQP